MSPRKRRDQSEPLTRQRVVTAALEIVDRDGLDGLTMRALGKELGVDPMAAYYYFPNKGALLDGVVEAVWTELNLPAITDEPWQVQLERIAYAVRDTLRSHPNALPVLATRPNQSAAGFRLTDRTLGVLRLAGLPPQEALEFVNAAGEFLLGHVLAEVGMPSAGAGDEEILSAFAEANVADEFPHLVEAFEAGVRLSKITMDRIFEAGLRAFRLGLEKQVEAHAATPGKDRRDGQ